MPRPPRPPIRLDAPPPAVGALQLVCGGVLADGGAGLPWANRPWPWLCTLAPVARLMAVAGAALLLVYREPRKKPALPAPPSGSNT